MKLGIITDIHEQIDYLATALAAFERVDVDQIVVLGDVLLLGDKANQTCKLLADKHVVGVWGNHDFGLCRDLEAAAQKGLDQTAVDFLASLRPRLEIGGCHFSHVEPWLDPNDVADLWYFEGPPNTDEKVARIFNLAPNRLMFAGHFHHWFLATPNGASDWHGETPIQLRPDERYFVTIAALCDGNFATFDTDSGELVPFSEQASSQQPSDAAPIVVSRKAAQDGRRKESRMQIGVMNHPARDPLEEIEWIGQNGFDFVDFTLEPPAAAPDGLDIDAIRAALDRHGLGVVAHTAYYLPLGSPFASVRAACLEEFRRCLQTAREIGATVMNTHYGKPPKFCSSPHHVVERHAEVLGPLCEDAEKLGMTVVLEHAPGAGPHQLENFLAIMERVPLLRFHLDSGHAKLERDYDRWDEYLDGLADKLVHVHLSDNDGTSDQHLPLGGCPASKTNWPEHIRKLKATGYDGTITLEVFSPERNHVLSSRDLLRQWWDE